MLLLIETGTGGSVWMTILAAVENKNFHYYILGKHQMTGLFSLKLKSPVDSIHLLQVSIFALFEEKDH